jgi:hypothetical protein
MLLKDPKLLAEFVGESDGGYILIEVKNLTGETHEFGRALLTALTIARVKADLNESLSTFGGCVPSPGVSFQVGRNRMAFAKRLAEALVKSGVDREYVHTPECGRSGEPDELIIMLLPP